MLFWGIVRPCSATAATCLDGRRAEQERRLGLARVDGCARLVGGGRIADVRRVARDELGVELAFLAGQEPRAGACVHLDERQAVRGRGLERRELARCARRSGGSGRSSALPARSGRSRRGAMRSPRFRPPRGRRARSRSGGGRRRSAGSPRSDRGQAPRGLSLLLRGATAGCGRPPARRRDPAPPSGPASAPSYRRKIGSTCVRVARSRRRRPSFGPAWVRSCGRITPAEYGSTRSGADEPVAPAGDPVRPGVVLGEPPERRSLVAGRARPRAAMRESSRAASASSSGSVSRTTLYGLRAT